jgi:flagellar hook protein FlgE
MAVGSFSAGLAGLNANSTYLRVIGNNLANINTVGFKSSDASFVDLVNQNVSGASENPTQIGLGVATGSISKNFGQGAIANTQTPTNAAIQGNGFFMVASSDGTAFTRAGNFLLDNNGALATPDGFKVQGYTQLDAQGKVITTGQPTDIVVPPGVLRAPVATTTFSTSSNLDASAAAGATFSASVQLYDSLGNPHTASINYTKTGAGAWSYAVTVPGAEATGGTTGTPFSVATGTLTFKADGTLNTVNGAAAADVSITTPTWKNGAAASALTWDLVNANGVGSVTGYANASATSAVSQNGSAPGQLNNIAISSDGTISATIGAGQTVAVGQIAIANFNNPQGLFDEGSNRFGQTQAAGVANVGVAGTGGRGTLIGSALEQSNVDIAQEFTNMIIAQRGYQANAKSITTSDQLLVDTVNLKQ